MPGRLRRLVCCIFVCNLVRLHLRLVVMAVEDVPPSTSLLGSSSDQHYHEEEQQQCKRCILQDDRRFRCGDRYMSHLVSRVNPLNTIDCFDQ